MSKKNKRQILSTQNEDLRDVNTNPFCEKLYKKYSFRLIVCFYIKTQDIKSHKKNLVVSKCKICNRTTNIYII